MGRHSPEGERERERERDAETVAGNIVLASFVTSATTQTAEDEDDDGTQGRMRTSDGRDRRTDDDD